MRTTRSSHPNQATIKPGDGKEGDQDDAGEKRNVTTPDTMMDLLRNCIPDNVVGATIQQARTELEVRMMYNYKEYTIYMGLSPWVILFFISGLTKP